MKWRPQADPISLDKEEERGPSAALRALVRGSLALFRELAFDRVVLLALGPGGRAGGFALGLP